MIYDGTGGKPLRGDLAIDDDRIAAVGDLGTATAHKEIDAQGLAVAPGFINMLSWATESLLHDGRSQGDIRQGVTLEVMGEGMSMGPWNRRMKQDVRDRQSDIRFRGSLDDARRIPRTSREPRRRAERRFVRRCDDRSHSRDRL